MVKANGNAQYVIESGQSETRTTANGFNSSSCSKEFILIERETCYYETVERRHEKTDFESNNRTENIYENVEADADETDRSASSKLEEPDLVIGLETPTLNLPAACPTPAPDVADPKSVKDRMFLSTDDASCLLFTQTVTSPMLTPSEENIDFLKGFNQNTNSDNTNTIASQKSDDKTDLLGNGQCEINIFPSHAPNIVDDIRSHAPNIVDVQITTEDDGVSQVPILKPSVTFVQTSAEDKSHAPAAVEDLGSPENFYENDEILDESENIYENIDDLRTDLKTQTTEFILNETYDQLPACRPVEKSSQRTANESDNAYEILNLSPELPSRQQTLPDAAETSTSATNSPQPKETSNSDKSPRETSHIANSPRETSNIDNSKKETSNINNSNKETSSFESFNKKTSSSDSLKKETSNSNNSPKETSHIDNSNNEMSNFDNSLIEMSHIDNSNNESSNIDDTNKETSNIDNPNKQTTNSDSPIKATSQFEPSNKQRPDSDVSVTNRPFDRVEAVEREGTVGDLPDVPAEINDSLPATETTTVPLHIVQTLKKQFGGYATKQGEIEVGSPDVTRRIGRFENVGPSKEEQPTNSCDDVVSLLFVFF